MTLPDPRRATYNVLRRWASRQLADGCRILMREADAAIPGPWEKVDAEQFATRIRVACGVVPGFPESTCLDMDVLIIERLKDDLTVHF